MGASLTTISGYLTLNDIEEVQVGLVLVLMIHDHSRDR